MVDVALIMAVGRLYGVRFPDVSRWPLVAAVLVLGAASFCALGVAIASIIRNAEAAPAVVQLVLFPLVFISGTYMPIHSEVLKTVTAVLPVRPFNDALLAAFGTDSGIPWRNLGVLLFWGAAGSLVAIRRFRWDPRPE
jgi:ABC-2 type transport system permease protein